MKRREIPPAVSGSKGSEELAPESRSPEPGFEDEVRRLGQIVEEMESGELPLEQSLLLFEEGVRLARQAQARLDQAERRVEELLGIDENGVPLVRELERDS